MGRVCGTDVWFKHCRADRTCTLVKASATLHARWHWVGVAAFNIVVDLFPRAIGSYGSANYNNQLVEFRVRNLQAKITGSCCSQEAIEL